MRAVALKVPISALNAGQYVKSEEQYVPNYVEYNGFQISRVNIIAVVVDKYQSQNADYIAFTIDDGTGQIRVKLYGEDIYFGKDIEVGDLVRIIGRVRETDDERFLVGEIVKKQDDPNMELVWRLDVMKNFPDAWKKKGEEETPELTTEKTLDDSPENDKRNKKEKKKDKKKEKDLKEGKEKKEEDVLMEIEEIEV